MSIFRFVPPGPPPLDDSPTFRQHRVRRTRDGLVCYFCASDYDEEGAYAPCCPAADEANQMARQERQERLMRALFRSDR